MKADAISTEFSEENATLLWRSGLMHSPVLTLTATQLNQLLEAARAEGAAKQAQKPRGLRGWLVARLLGDDKLAIIAQPVAGQAGPTSAVLVEAPAPEADPVVAPIEIDEDLQAQVRALYRTDP